MKRASVVVVAVVVLVSLTGMANAALQYNWFMQLQPRGGPGVMAMAPAALGTQTDALDGDDSATANWDSAAIPALSYTVELDVVGDQLPADGRWENDIRAPLLNPGYKIWNLKAYMNGSLTQTTTFKLCGWLEEGYGRIVDPRVGIYLYDGNFTAAQCMTATPLWSITSSTAAYGHQASPAFASRDFTLASPTDTHYFTVMEYIVPEPGGLAALLTGLLGFGGFAIRRRK